MTSSPNKVAHLESSLQEISQIIAQMEQGNLTLDESLQFFERAIKLTKDCQSILSDAEQKVQILLQGSNNLSDIDALKTDAESMAGG